MRGWTDEPTLRVGSLVIDSKGSPVKLVRLHPRPKGDYKWVHQLSAKDRQHYFRMLDLWRSRK